MKTIDYKTNREIKHKPKKYTPIRKFYAVFGFIHIIAYIIIGVMYAINHI